MGTAGERRTAGRGLAGQQHAVGDLCAHAVSGLPSAVLLVICPNPREADKCRRVIRMGHPGWDLYPIVIDPAHAPAGDGAGPYLTLFLACLPALDMTQEDNARRVLAAIRDTGGSHAERKRLTAIILKRATDAARQILEAMMKTDGM
jgi:hypothetical protein